MNRLLEKSPVVPVVVIEDAAKAVPVAQALVDGGLPVIEVTMRTTAAADAIAAISSDVPDAFVGAGTVLTTEDVDQVAQAGGQLIVSPNFDPEVVSKTKERGLTSCPGVQTPSEAMAALKLGADVLKLFPADLSAHWFLAIGYMKQKRLASALSAFSAIKELDPVWNQEMVDTYIASIRSSMSGPRHNA